MILLSVESGTRRISGLLYHAEHHQIVTMSE